MLLLLSELKTNIYCNKSSFSCILPADMKISKYITIYSNTFWLLKAGYCNSTYPAVSF